MSTQLRGRDLIDDPLYNRGTAFSEEERAKLNLYGLLPTDIETLEQQASRAYEAYGTKTTDLERHIYLRDLQDTNETLFYRLVVDHLKEMMPIIYTPVVGEACQKFSEIYRRPRGLFLPFLHRDRMVEMLRNHGREDVLAIVVTDGERILGLGDQGAGGMGIPIGKLSLYVSCGGIHPARTLPVMLDVGTNNPRLLDDPHYIGSRHERVSGDEYVAFVDTFIEGVQEVWPTALVQFEDFALPHANPLLARYRDRLCMFNDDVQGTAAVALGTLLGAVRSTGSTLSEQTVTLLGGGSAGSGIAEQIVAAMTEEGLAEAEARARVFVVDRAGLLHDGMEDLLPFQQPLVQARERVASWAGKGGEISLLDVVKNASPSILVGVSGQPGLFTEDVVRAMAAGAKRPIIFPLSNPNSRMEAHPRDLIEWTDGKALVATGSPVEAFEFRGQNFQIAQCNNTYVFPAVGLAVAAAGARRVTDEMLRAGARALAEQSPAAAREGGALLPAIHEIRGVTRDVARAIALEAIAEGHAECSAEEIDARIEATFWEPGYPTA